MVQKRPSTRTTFPQFDETKSVGPKSAGESVHEVTETAPTPPPEDDPVPESEGLKATTPSSVPVAIINL